MSTRWKGIVSVKVAAGSRTYSFELKRTVGGARCLTISEIRQSGGERVHQCITVYEEDFDAFANGFECMAESMASPVKGKAYDVREIRRRYPRAYEHWGPEEDSELVQKFEEGLSLSELSNIFGRKPSAIRSRLRKLRQEPNSQRCRPGTGRRH